MSKKIHIGSMSREQAIGILNKLMVAMKTYDGVSPTQERINALQIAIASLETDEAYQLEYEKPEICKADNSVLEDIKAKISDMYPNYIDEKGYRMLRKSDVLNIIDYCMGKRG